MIGTRYQLNYLRSALQVGEPRRAALGLATEAMYLALGGEAAYPRARSILGRALAVRHVDAGSCNGCELVIHALGNPYYNLEGLGMKFVASPRHADLLLVTGPVSRNMEQALLRTYAAMPEPKLVVAVGDCGCTGGIFGESYASRGRVSNVLPVDVAVPGCPPEPAAILQAILTAVTSDRRNSAASP